VLRDAERFARETADTSLPTLMFDPNEFQAQLICFCMKPLSPLLGYKANCKW